MKNNQYLLSTKAVRDRCLEVFNKTKDGHGLFELDLTKLDAIADFVVDVTKANYPDLKIPFHSRRRHFLAGNIDRLTPLKNEYHDSWEWARSWIDLTLVSVLLDAGAGMGWKYFESQSAQSFSKSEGLAVASFDMFINGLFSSKRESEVDGKGLVELQSEDLKAAFQVTEKNPLVGVEGRCKLLNNLGHLLLDLNKYFPDARPGDMLLWFKQNKGMQIKATDILEFLLNHFSSIWPGRIIIDGKNLGDVWHSPMLGRELNDQSVVPFHKLSQWLTYSLIEPFESAGFKVSGLDEMTGLPEYRNGGLFIDMKALTLKDKNKVDRTFKVDDPEIVEWRALTVILLDQLHPIVCKKLGFKLADFPLVKMLEGGSWWAGRRIAASLRSDGGPPLKVSSDGTVF